MNEGLDRHHSHQKGRAIELSEMFIKEQSETVNRAVESAVGTYIRRVVHERTRGAVTANAIPLPWHVCIELDTQAETEIVTSVELYDADMNKVYCDPAIKEKLKEDFKEQYNHIAALGWNGETLDFRKIGAPIV